MCLPVKHEFTKCVLFSKTIQFFECNLAELVYGYLDFFIRVLGLLWVFYKRCTHLKYESNLTFAANNLSTENKFLVGNFTFRCTLWRLSNFDSVRRGVLKKKPLTFTYPPRNFTLIKNFNIFFMLNSAVKLF